MIGKSDRWMSLVGVRLVDSSFEESNWASKSGFIAAFGGLAIPAFYGKDDWSISENEECPHGKHGNKYTDNP